MSAPFKNGGFLAVEGQQPSAELITGLAESDFLAARFPDFVAPETLARFIANARNIPGEGYADEPSFKKVVGGAIYSGASDRDALAKYFRSVSAWNAEARELFHPYLSPADRLRLVLQEVWPAGCNAEFIDGRPTFSGLIRLIEESGEARPHQDMTNWDIPDFESPASLLTNLSAVIYFEVADEGGELELWDWGFTDQAEYKGHQVEGDYSLDRNKIGGPKMTLRPRGGELIIFNARRIHAVRPVLRGRRSTQSLFIGYRGILKALSTYS